MSVTRIFIANRGEIALRVIRAATAAGLETVLGVSEADRDSLPARMASRTVCLGPAPASASYLNIDAVVTAAKGTGCDALHPGYGFLAENAALADLCAAQGITFIGPRGDTLRALGDKLTAGPRSDHGFRRGQSRRGCDWLSSPAESHRRRRRAWHAGGAQRSRPATRL